MRCLHLCVSHVRYKFLVKDHGTTTCDLHQCGLPTVSGFQLTVSGSQLT